MTNIVAIDTETTGLHPERRAWDIGLIVVGEIPFRYRSHRSLAQAEVEPDSATPTRHAYQWFVDVQDLDLGNADPFALKVGHFYERHPQMAGTPGVPQREEDVLEQVEWLTRDAHLVGALPSFDAEVLGARMRAHGMLPSWYYHVIDVEPLVIGFLHGAGHGEGWSLPYKSDDLSRAVGVVPPGDADRHTALGDARWALRLYEAITGGES